MPRWGGGTIHALSIPVSGGGPLGSPIISGCPAHMCPGWAVLPAHTCSRIPAPVWVWITMTEEAGPSTPSRLSSAGLRARLECSTAARGGWDSREGGRTASCPWIPGAGGVREAPGPFGFRQEAPTSQPSCVVCRPGSPPSTGDPGAAPRACRGRRVPGCTPWGSPLSLGGLGEEPWCGAYGWQGQRRG